MSPAGTGEDILIGLGSNLALPRIGPPRAVLEAALADLAARGIGLSARSRWYESAPVPVSDQPWFVNGVALLDTDLPPDRLLAELHAVERAFGRQRRVVNEARPLDLDLLAYGGRVAEGPEPPLLPHPRLAQRAFVLLPLAELRPHWRHPATGMGIAALIAALPADQVARPIAGQATPGQVAPG
ncbi:MAG: 2-amino-4-hydroxy-6-hydroxymethyldihydropteridine diphosphokinase [Dongiaceae bacterium]